LVQEWLGVKKVNRQKRHRFLVGNNTVLMNVLSRMINRNRRNSRRILGKRPVAVRVKSGSLKLGMEVLLRRNDDKGLLSYAR
jgi:hypothetical protein